MNAKTILEIIKIVDWEFFSWEKLSSSDGFFNSK